MTRANLTISQLNSFFDIKSVTRGENHYRSGHVEKFSFSHGELTGLVRASMKEKVYRVSVSAREIKGYRPTN